MKKVDKKTMAMLINLLIIVLEIIAFIIRPNRYGEPAWAFYTVISNYICLFSSLLFVVCYFIKKEPRWLSTLRFTATMMLLMTFVIVVCVLIWFADPYELLVEKNSSIHHIIAPLLTFLSYLFFENHISKFREIIPFMAISLVYSFVIVTLNSLGIVNGPYPFFMVQLLGLPLVILFCFIIAIIFLIFAIVTYQLIKKHEQKL